MGVHEWIHRWIQVLYSPVPSLSDVITSLPELDLYEDNVGDSLFYGHSRQNPPHPPGLVSSVQSNYGHPGPPMLTQDSL